VEHDEEQSWHFWLKELQAVENSKNQQTIYFLFHVEQNNKHL